MAECLFQLTQIYSGSIVCEQ